MFEFLEAYQNFANTTGIFAPFFRLLGLIPIIFFWFTILYPIFYVFKKHKLEEDYKKSIIETEKHLRKIAENSEKNSNQ